MKNKKAFLPIKGTKTASAWYHPGSCRSKRHLLRPVTGSAVAAYQPGHFPHVQRRRSGVNLGPVRAQVAFSR